MNEDLQIKLAAMPDSPAKADLMAKLALEMRENDPRQGAELCRLVCSLSQTLSYKRGMADGLKILSGCELLLAEFQPALAHAVQALALMRELDDQASVIKLNNLMGIIHRHLGDYAAAVESFRAVQQSAQAAGDRLMEGSALNNLGIIYQHVGDLAQALESFTRSRDIFKDLGETRFYTNSLINVADGLRQAREFEKALECCREALQVFHELGDRHGEASARYQLGVISRDTGDDAGAMAEWEKSVEMAREIGNTETEMISLIAMAQMYTARRQATAALEVLDLASGIAGTVREKRALTELYGAYAAAYHQTGDKDNERRYDELHHAMEEELKSQKVDRV
jgi:tetratricopeptide (TPR) repeat protein